MRISVICLLFFLATIGKGIADTPARPMPRTFVSPAGSALFTMLPAVYGENYKIIRKPFGVAYRLLPDGKLEELYRTNGWYSFEVFITDDGQYLTRMGPWNGGNAPSKNDLALAFLKNGVEIKRYSTADLIKDPAQIIVSTSHYEWRAPHSLKVQSLGEMLALAPRLIGYGNEFVVHTIDEWSYYFDVTTGSITKSERTKIR